MRFRAKPWLSAGAVVVLAGCVAAVWLLTRGSSDGSGKLTVLAAASLTDVFPAIDPGETYSFGGSNALGTQVANGVPADVFASANASIPERLHAEGLVEQPVAFARNRLVVIAPRANPAHVRSVNDLTRPGVTVDIAQAGVPVGDYTLEALDKLGLTAQVLRNVASRETDVRAVLTKVVLGQADAGVVYATDARQAEGDIVVVPIPKLAQPETTYAVAVVSTSTRRAEAQAFVRSLLVRSGRATLTRYGFTPCCLAQPTPGPRRAARAPGEMRPAEAS